VSGRAFPNCCAPRLATKLECLRATLASGFLFLAQWWCTGLLCQVSININGFPMCIDGYGHAWHTFANAFNAFSTGLGVWAWSLVLVFGIRQRASLTFTLIDVVARAND